MNTKNAALADSKFELSPSSTLGSEESKSSQRKSLTPSQMVKKFSSQVVGHDEAKLAMASALYWLQHAPATRRNIILTGPHHCGKSTLVKTAANVLGLPHVTPDLSDYLASQAGGAGKNVNDMVSLLLRQVRKADLGSGAIGIISLEGIEQLAARDSDMGSRKELLQLAVARLASGKTVHCAFGGKLVSVDTTKILFVASMNPQGIEQLISKRLHGGSLGFAASAPHSASHAAINEITTEDLIKYGFHPDFLAAFDLRASLKAPGKKELFELCKREASLLAPFYQAFARHGVILEISESVLHEVAHQAVAMKIGVQGVFIVAHAVLDPVLIQTADLAGSIQKVQVRELHKPPHIVFGAPLIAVSSDASGHSEDYLSEETKALFPDGFPRRSARPQSAATSGRLATERDLAKWLKI